MANVKSFGVILLLIAVEICSGKIIAADKELGESCSVKEDCIGNEDKTDCIFKVCSCNDNHVEVEDTGKKECVERAKAVGDPCDHHQQCSANLGESICYMNECICNLTDAYEGVTGICLPFLNELGAVCEEHMQCTYGIPGSLSECLPRESGSAQKTCQCQAEAVIVPGKHKCYARLEYGQVCEENLQCSGNIGECDDSNKCVCLDKISIKHPDEDKCLRLSSNLGDKCEHSIQCTEGISEATNSLCKAGQCGCPDGFIPNSQNSKCLKTAEQVGHSCESTSQCTITLGESSFCNNPYDPALRECACKNNSMESVDKKKCLPFADKLDYDCEVDEQCTRGVPGEQSFCDSTTTPVKCNCNPTSLYDPAVGEMCLRIAEKPGDNCTIDEQCTRNPDLGVYSICRGLSFPFPTTSKVCTCNPVYAVPGANKCLLLVNNLHEECEVTNQCKNIYGAECRSVEDGAGVEKDQCECKKETYYETTGDKPKCLPIVNNEGVSCVEDKQCTLGMGNDAHCSDSKRCKCKDAFFFYDKSCYQKAELNEKCSSNVNCLLGGNNFTECIQEKCQCNNKSMEYEKSCLEIKKIGEPCENTVQCNVTIPGLAECYARECRCASGYSPTEDMSVCNDDDAGSVLQTNGVMLYIILSTIAISKIELFF